MSGFPDLLSGVGTQIDTAWQVRSTLESVVAASRFARIEVDANDLIARLRKGHGQRRPYIHEPDDGNSRIALCTVSTRTG